MMYCSRLCHHVYIFFISEYLSCLHTVHLWISSMSIFDNYHVYMFPTMWSRDRDVVLVGRTIKLGKPWGDGNLEWGGNGEREVSYLGPGWTAVLPTPGKIIRPGHQKNSAAGSKNLPYPAAACMIIVDLCFFLQQFKQYFGELWHNDQ